MDIRDLYLMKQDELYDFILEFVTLNAEGKFDVITDELDPMYIVLLPKHAKGFFPALVSHLDTCVSDAGRSLLYNDVVPDSVETISIDDRDYHVGIKDGERFILGGDDRNGVWTMLTLIGRGHHDWGYIFTKDEEPRLTNGRYSCLNGALALAQSSAFWSVPQALRIGYFLQIDMPYTNKLGYHTIQYSGRLTNSNQEFSSLLDRFDPAYEQLQLSVTDISVLCAVTDLCGTNISAGYYCWHTCDERSDIEYVRSLPDMVCRLISHLGDRQYKIE